MDRRNFLAASAALSAAPLAAAPGVRIGCDLFSVRSQGWTPIQHLDYCAKLGARVVHFSEIRFLGSLETDNLKRVRAHAERLGIELEIGMRSICPTSKAFDPAQGTAEQQIERMIAAARTIGSPIVRAFLGTMADRTGATPIEGHIENAVKALRAVRTRVLDAGLKMAIENHAGDMQARELKTLVEEAGKDFVGVCLDSGNPLWAIEDPHLTLETLAPYTLTSHIRDSAVWRTPDGGVAVAWVRLGEGNVAIDDYIRKYSRLCAGKALSLEILVTGPRAYPIHEPKFWDAYRRTPAWEFARFLAWADKGKPREAPSKLDKEAAAAREREDLEVSMAYLKKLLG